MMNRYSIEGAERKLDRKLFCKIITRTLIIVCMNIPCYAIESIEEPQEQDAPRVIYPTQPVVKSTAPDVAKAEIPVKAISIGFISPNGSSQNHVKSVFQERTIGGNIVVVVGLNNETDTEIRGNVDVKLFDPTGSLLQGKYAPPGYFGRNEARVSRSYKNYYLHINGYTGVPYRQGVYRAEAYWEGNLIISGSFQVIPQTDPLTNFTSASDFQDNVAQVRLRQGGFPKLLDRNGAIMKLSAQYDILNVSPQGVIKVLRNGGWGFIDKQGNILVAAVYQNAKNFSEGLAPVKNDTRWGYVDKNGKTVIGELFEDAFPFSEGLARVKVGGKWGFINKTGQIIIPFVYSWVADFSEGLALVSFGRGEYNYINKENRLISSKNFLYSRSFSEGMAVSRASNGKWGFIDKSGQWAIPPQMQNAQDFRAGMAYVWMNGKSYFINRSGQTVVATFPYIMHARTYSGQEYRDENGFYEDLVVMFDPNSKKYGYMDKTGRMLIPAQFAVAKPFSNGLARVVLHDGCGWVYIDKTGSIIINEPRE